MAAPGTVLAAVWLHMSNTSFENPEEEDDFVQLVRYLERFLYSLR